MIILLDVRFFVDFKKTFCMSSYCLLAFTVFNEKSYINLMGVALYMMSHFSPDFKIFSLAFNIFTMMCMGVDLSNFEFVELIGYVDRWIFHQVLEIFTNYFVQYFFSASSLSPLLLGLLLHIC